MDDISKARRRWIEDRPKYKAFGEALEPKLKSVVRRLGLPAAVSSRPKDIDSLLKKLIRKPRHTYDSLGDKLGARIVVKLVSDVDRVVAEVQKMFDCGPVDDKADELKDDKVGYLSKHIDIRLRSDDPLASNFPPDRFRAELQVRTLAQNLWSEHSHGTTYKDGNVVVPRLKRRVNLLAGLIEVADNEFEWLDREISNLPDVPESKILKALERHYYTLTGRLGDANLSLQVIRLLFPLYGTDADAVSAHLDQFLGANHEYLERIFEKVESADEERSAFMFQPEVLLIYDQLKSHEYSLREQWVKEFPFEELERIASRFGISFD
jgi:ppGpp synthetase/RelA/SpoT-type nucleotidyltranferase